MFDFNIVSSMGTVHRAHVVRPIDVVPRLIISWSVTRSNYGQTGGRSRCHLAWVDPGQGHVASNGTTSPKSHFATKLFAEDAETTEDSRTIGIVLKGSLSCVRMWWLSNDLNFLILSDSRLNLTKRHSRLSWLLERKLLSTGNILR